MSDFHSLRSRIIRAIFAGAFILIILQLFNLQVLSNKYSRMAEDQAIYRKIVYPSRGLVYGKGHKIILDNTTLYDLVVIPSQLRGVDTGIVLKILGIDTADFKERVITAIIKNGRYQPSVFQGLLDERSYAQLNENLYKIQPGFDLIARPVRKYPYEAAGPMLGYLGEADSNFLKKHEGEGYRMGDYVGINGIEKTYEKALMGERGIEYWLRDNKNRPTQQLENGKFDSAAMAGKDLYTSIDMELQEFGEKLMKNKMGSVVAINPKTGSIIAMISGPGYQPSRLTGSERRKYFNSLLRDPLKPLLNRSVGAIYSPGSTFKTLNALIGLQEGVITTQTSFYCPGAYVGCGKRMGCLDPGTFAMQMAITHSCNGYFGNVMERIINNPSYPNIDSSLNVWARYMNGFGLGHRLGIDIPGERPGNIPNAAYYNRAWGAGRWNYCSFKSVSIGQGEVNSTPIQVANEMAYIANKGWYYIPHVVDSIEGGDKWGLLDKYRVKQTSVQVDDSVFEAVHEGMYGVMEHGTGRGSRIEGIAVCGKTGTVENYAPGGVIKRPNHAFFAAFAPREDPQIAIMCVVENSGRFGGTYAAPIVSLLIEKYLRDSITDKGRLAKAKWIEDQYLIPGFVYEDFKRQDSIDHRKDTAYLLNKGYMKKLRDTLGIEDIEMEVEQKRDDKKKAPANTPPPTQPQPQPNQDLMMPTTYNNEKKKPGQPDKAL
jgi:penicillin-binding protein 2